MATMTTCILNGRSIGIDEALRLRRESERLGKTTPIRLLFLLSAFVIGGCAKTEIDLLREDIDASNYRKKSTIVMDGTPYFSGRYTGSLSGCFPPAGGIICDSYDQGKATYEIGSKLPVERISLSVSSMQVGGESKIRDYMFLVISDIAISKGYKFIADLGKTKSYSCYASIGASTVGMANGYGNYANYYGTTRISSNRNCANTYGMRALLLNDRGIVEKGVFTKSVDGSGRPVIELYFGSKGTDILSPNFSQYYNMSSSPDGSMGHETITPTNSYKTLYDAQGLSRDLRAKYGISDRTPYQILTEEPLERQIHQGKKDDVIDRNKVLN